MVDRRKSCSGLCMVLVFYLLPGPLLRQKRVQMFPLKLVKHPNYCSPVSRSRYMFFHSANHDADRHPLVVFSLTGQLCLHLCLYFVFVCKHKLRDVTEQLYIVRMDTLTMPNLSVCRSIFFLEVPKYEM